MVFAPFDAGQPFMRNRMVQRARTPYVLLVEDDVVFDLGANLRVLLRNLLGWQYSIVAGQNPPPLVRQQQSQLQLQQQQQQKQSEQQPGQQQHSLTQPASLHAVPVLAASGAQQSDLSGLMKLDMHTLHLRRGDYGSDGDCRIVDFVPNTFMADRASLLQLRWDEHLKLGSSSDFFWRAKEINLKVGSCSGFWLTRTVDLASPLSWHARMWQRTMDFVQLMLRKHGWTRMLLADHVLAELGTLQLQEEDAGQDWQRMARQICATGITGERCDRCLPGFGGPRCTRCLPGHFGSHCVPCRCANGLCVDGLLGDGSCYCSEKLTQNCRGQPSWWALALWLLLLLTVLYLFNEFALLHGWRWLRRQKASRSRV